MNQKPKWMKSKGFLHITPTLNISQKWRDYLRKIKSSEYVAQYAFYPLLYREIKERRYKKVKLASGKTKRAHSYKDPETGKTIHNKKIRPIHYATHFDSLIYAYYGHFLKNLHEKELSRDTELNKAVTAYRSIPVNETASSGKCNIHFAKEVFDEINNRVRKNKQVAVLAMDLKSFFSSLSHSYLHKSWASLLGRESLPEDHQNVFNACTNFSYILYDDLRKYPNGPFDEAKLAKIRKEHGYRCFFTSNEEFRKEIQAGRLSVFKNPFRRPLPDGTKKMKGIPQGLPISAVLANIYLLDFDREIIETFVKKESVFYRRYSDDIIILCPLDKMDVIKQFINRLTEKYSIDINSDKTEKFIFKKMPYNHAGDKRISSIKLQEHRCVIDSPLTYLGFEFRGFNTLIKSSNLAKYYRRLIYTIKSRAKRANKLSEKNPHVPRAVYLNQIKKLYNRPLKDGKHKTENKQVFRTRYNLVVNDRGEFDFSHYEIEGHTSNYISYIRRCDRIFETDAFSRQLKKKKQIIGQAINKHLIQKGDK